MGQKYGQHFLHDQGVLVHILQCIEAVRMDGYFTILEIGPGKGALTKHLVQKERPLVLSEIDTSLEPVLKKLIGTHDVPIVWGDVLAQVAASSSPGAITLGGQTLAIEQTIVVGNLPYYITSPILRLFFGDTLDLPCGFPGGVFLVQREVAEKIRRDAKKKSYLRWLLNRTHKVSYAFTVKAGSFTPPPKVESAVIVVEKLASSSCDLAYKERLLSFLHLASPYKRKTLGKIQKMHQDDFANLGMSIPDDLLGTRLEELGWEEMRGIVENRLKN